MTDQPRPTTLTRKELRPCAHCGKGLMHDGAIVVYRARVEQLVLDRQALSRAAGMEMMMGGNAAIAAVFAPDNYYAHVMDEKTVVLCQQCALGSSVFAVLNSDPQQEVER